MSTKTKIRDFLIKKAKKSVLAEKTLYRFRWLQANRNARMSDMEFAQMLWKKTKGHAFNWQQPRTYDEKMWFLKLSNRNPLLTKCSDKHEAREYVRECGLEDILKKEYGVFSRAEDIDFTQLPEECYIKCNHASGMNWVYKKEQPFDRRFFNWKFNYLLKQNPYLLSREWNYKNIKPRIVCEEVLSMPDGSDIPELQFFCFHGVPKFIMYNVGLADAQGNHKKATRWVFDPEYQLIHVKTSMRTTDTPPEKPEGFTRMLEIAERLSKPFEHVRVDLFNLNGKIYFNELTFYSGGGFVKLEPESWQEKLGEWIDLSGYTIAPDALQRNVMKKHKLK